jgi:hypothetical protein
MGFEGWEFGSGKCRRACERAYSQDDSDGDAE